ERIPHVRAVALRLEAITEIRLSARAGLGDGHLRRRLERVRDRAAGAIPEMSKGARAARAVRRRVVGEVGSPGCTFGDRVRSSCSDAGIGAVATVERVAHIRIVAL